MPMAEDLSPFFNAAEFASVCTLNGVQVRGIFDAPHSAPMGIATSEPTLVMPAHPQAVKGARLVIGSDAWHVRSVEPDGTGVVTLILERE